MSGPTPVGNNSKEDSDGSENSGSDDQGGNAGGKSPNLDLGAQGNVDD